MTPPTVTVYSCVLNEVSTIRELMESLLSQTRRPEEILIVDGGSTDGTLEALETYSAHEPRIRVVLAPGTNIAQARNVAVREATGCLLASIDAGCVARNDWLEHLLDRLDEKVDIVSGVYTIEPASDWELVMRVFFYPDISRLPENWNEPSHNSVLIRRRVWEAVGPLPERLYRSEDSWFNERAARLGFRFRLARDAVVYRKPRESYHEVFRNTWLWVESDFVNNVNMPFEWRRAARIGFRLTSKILALSLWLAACVFSPIAGALASPLAIASLVKLTYGMPSIRYIAIYNAVDYVVMVASTGGALSGCLKAIARASSDPST